MHNITSKLALLLLATPVTLCLAVSFDCRQASTIIEKQICAASRKNGICLDEIDAKTKACYKKLSPSK